jgi:hypothetical protein
MGLRPPDDRRESQRDRLDEVARLSIAAVTEDLVRILGLKRTAVIGAVKDTRIVQQWIRAERTPQRSEALRTALQAARLLADSDGQDVAQAWFTGCNPHLKFESPILALREGNDPEVFSEVVRAAFEFVQR